MLFASRVPVSVGLIRWPSGVAATVVVKRSYDLSPRGATVSRMQEPLGLDRYDAAGGLIYPSDFAPTKALCDVAVVGPALHDPAGPVQIAVGAMLRRVERAAHLAPRPSPGPYGDPTDSSLAGQWGRAGFDFERFQWAAGEQRLPVPTLPLDVFVDVGAHRAAARLEGPAPEVLLVDETGWIAPRPIPMRLDGVGLDLARQRVDLVWRGLLELVAGTSPLLVVDPAASLRTASPRDLATWPRAEAVEPSLLRRLAARGGRISSGGTARVGEIVDEAETTGRIALDDFGDDAASSGSITSRINIPAGLESVLPFSSAEEPGGVGFAAPGSTAAPTAGLTGVDEAPRATIAFEIPPELAAAPSPGVAGLPFARSAVDEPEEDPLARTVAGVVSPARSALPFVRDAAPALPQRSPIVVHDDEPHDPLVATAAIVSHGSSPLPFHVLSAPAPLPAVVSAAPAAVSALRAPAPAPAPVEAAAPSPPRAEVAPSSGMTPERYGAIKAELWSSGAGRRATLRKHGLDEVTWRLAERRFVHAVARGSGADEARAVVRRLRDEVSRRSARRGA